MIHSATSNKPDGDSAVLRPRSGDLPGEVIVPQANEGWKGLGGRFRRSKRCGDRRGVAAVELAAVAPLLILILFGIIEFGRMIMVQQILTNASREGARRAIIEDATNSEVQQLVSNYLSSVSLNTATVTVTPNDLSKVGFGDAVSVTVAIPFDDVSWAGPAWFLVGTTLEANTIMQGERLQ